MTVEARVISHNLAGGPATTVIAQVNAWGADFLCAQEVVVTAADELTVALPDWALAFTPMHSIGGVLKGQVIGSRHGLTDIIDHPLGFDDGPKQFHLTHGDTVLDGVNVRLFNTHLRAFDTAAAKLGRKRQAQMVAAALAPYVEGAWAVIGGGDFNDGPLFDPLDHMYYSNGNGDFVECDQTDASNASPRDGDTTVANRDSKIDYVWFSRRCTTFESLSGGQVGSPTSDHLILRGLAQVVQPVARY